MCLASSGKYRRISLWKKDEDKIKHTCVHCITSAHKRIILKYGILMMINLKKNAYLNQCTKEIKRLVQSHHYHLHQYYYRKQIIITF